MRPQICLFWAILLFSVNFTPAQPIEFEKFADDQGLIDNNITSITKDNAGFLWISTKQGLEKYDSYTHKHFSNDSDHPNSLLSAWIQCLLSTRNGDIYIGSHWKGLSIYNKRAELFDHFKHNPSDETSLSNDSIGALFESKDGSIWVGTLRGLDKFDPILKKFTRYYPYKEERCKGVTGICEDEEGNLWLNGPCNKPCKMDPKSHTFHFLELPGLLFKASPSAYSAIFCDSKNRLWFGSEWDGLFKYDLKKGTVERFALKNSFGGPFPVNCFMEEDIGNIWIGTFGGGLYVYKPKDQDLEHYHELRNTMGISSNRVTCIFQVQPGVVWVGTEHGAVNIYKRDKIKFEKYSDNGEEGKILSHSSVLAITPSLDEKIWLGTEGGGLDLFDPKTKKITYFTHRNSLIESDTVKSIFVEKDGTIWYGIYGKILSKVNFKTGLAQNYKQEIEQNLTKKPENCAWCLLKSSDDKLYIGLLYGGVKVYDLKTKRFIEDANPLEEFQKHTTISRIWYLMEDSKKRIWVGTENNGAICYEPWSKKYQVFANDPNDTTSIKANLVKSVVEDRNGTFWIGQKGGISKLVDFNKKKFINYTMHDGLPNNNVKGIVEDMAGDLWISTAKGISCFNTQTKKFKNYDQEDGLQGANYHTGSVYETKTGVIYMGGGDGFNIFHPNSIPFHTFPPITVITDFKILDQSIGPNTLLNGKKYVQDPIESVKKIELNPSDNIFTIEFASLDYMAPHKNKFAYKLEGFKNEWSYTNADKRLAMYTNLDPGTYVFKVKACNRDGIWSSEETSLTIVILAPFYKTWWFVFLMLSAMSTFFYLLYYFWKTRSVRKRNLELKKEVEKQTMELNEKNDRLRVAYRELTEGLEAAKHIQSAILPEKTALVKEFGHIDVLYQPKEIVSGDFYWFSKIDKCKVLATVDCTGHGVAGAFMTFVGYDALNQLAKSVSNADPGIMLTKLNQEILGSITEQSSRALQVGMDVSICSLDSKTGILYFAGANSPLYLVRGKELIILKGDRQGVGGKQRSEAYQFATQSVQLEKGDQVYIFSDGYADQIGGASGREKFMYFRLRDALLLIQKENISTRIDLLNKKFQEWKGDQEQLDDVLVIGFDYHGSIK